MMAAARHGPRRTPGLWARWLVGALLLHSGGSLAADAAGQFAMKGAGLLPCGSFVAERERQSDAYYLIAGWVEGYLSAYNRASPDTYDITSFESTELLLSVIQGHCESHPDDRLHQVLQSMISQLHADRLREESPRVEISDGERTTRLYRETLTRIQQRLAGLGLYQGGAHGRWTDATAAALMAFQSDIGFEMTGFPDQATLWRLLRK